MGAVAQRARAPLPYSEGLSQPLRPWWATPGDRLLRASRYRYSLRWRGHDQGLFCPFSGAVGRDCTNRANESNLRASMRMLLASALLWSDWGADLGLGATLS
jgi:hypothetical protein